MELLIFENLVNMKFVRNKTNCTNPVSLDRLAYFSYQIKLHIYRTATSNMWNAINVLILDSSRQFKLFQTFNFYLSLINQEKLSEPLQERTWIDHISHYYCDWFHVMNLSSFCVSDLFKVTCET